MCNLKKIISEEAVSLDQGNTIQVLFDDGLATIFAEKVSSGQKKIVTLLEEIPHRISGSVKEYKRD